MRIKPNHRATLVYDVIGKDKQFGESRDFTAVRYEYASPLGFAAGINYNRVSDDRYFVDFATTIVDTSQKVLPQDGYLAYNQPYWNTAVRVTKNQTLQDPDTLTLVAKPYERVRRPPERSSPTGAASKPRRRSKARAFTPDARTGQPYLQMYEPYRAWRWIVHLPRARVSSTAYDLDPSFGRAIRRSPNAAELILDTV